MKLFKLTAAVAIAVATLSYVDRATALDSAQTGNWFDGSTWVGGSPPAANDDVVIKNGHTVTVDDITNSVDTVTVENGATLSMESDGDAPTTGILVVQESVTVGSTSGVFKFNEDADVTPILRADQGGSATPVTLDGPFTVTDSKGAIYDASSTNKFHLQTGSITSDSGAVTISAPFENDATIDATGSDILISGALDNDGTAQATGAAIALTGDVDNAGTISAAGAADGDDVTFSGTINASSSGLFQVTAANSEMIFEMSAAADIDTGADFLVSAGLMHFKQNLTTDGGYKQTDGLAKADATFTFTATGAYP